jgi:hypothetical protein
MIRRQEVFQVRNLIQGDEDFIGNPYWASNCEDCQYESLVERDEDGYPISYQCDKSPQWVTSETTVQFDYELSIASAAPPGDNVRAMAWSFLEYVAEQTGISDRCNFDDQYEDSNIQPRGGGSGRKKLSESMYYPTTIYAIRSHPEDPFGKTGTSLTAVSCFLALFAKGIYLVARDNSFSCASFPRSFISSGDCLAMKDYDTETSICVPVTAVMDVKYRGEPEDAIWVQEYLKTLIKDQILDDPSQLYVGNVNNLSYVGERISSNRTDDITRIQAGQGLGIATMTTIVSLSTLMVFGCAIVLMKRRKKSTIQEDYVEDYPKKTMADLELCSTESPTNSNSTVGSPNMLLVSTEDMPMPFFKERQQLQTSSSMDSNDRSIQSQEPSPRQEGRLSTTIQPPARRKSKTLKKQRKKKKKRKHTQKTSSRENMMMNPTMLLPISEIITEFDHDEEEDECSEIDTSESSSCDEDINSSTPVSTPTSEDIFDNDYDFIIETPHFSYTTKKKQHADVPASIPRMSLNEDREGSPSSLLSDASDSETMMDSSTPTNGCVSPLPVPGERSRNISPPWASIC